MFNEGLRSKLLLDDDGRTRTDPTRQYGTGGHLHGRGFFISSTWTAPADTFANPDSVLFGGRTVDDLLLSISTNYRFVGFAELAHYCLFDIFHGTRVGEDIAAYPAHLDRQLAALARLRTGEDIDTRAR